MNTKVKGQHLLCSLASIKFYNQQEAKRKAVPLIFLGLHLLMTWHFTCKALLETAFHTCNLLCTGIDRCFVIFLNISEKAVNELPLNWEKPVCRSLHAPKTPSDTYLQPPNSMENQSYWVTTFHQHQQTAFRTALRDAKQEYRKVRKERETCSG